MSQGCHQAQKIALPVSRSSESAIQPVILVITVCVTTERFHSAFQAVFLIRVPLRDVSCATDISWSFLSALY